MLENVDDVVQKAPVKKRRGLQASPSKKIFYYSLVFLPLLQFCIFYIGVNFQSILLAFQKYENSEFVFLSDNIFGNFQRVFTEFFRTKTLWTAFANSLILWFLTAICGTLIAVFFSYFIFKSKTVGRFYRFVLFLPSILPGIMLSIVFKLFTADVMPMIFGWEKVLESTNPTVRLVAVYSYTLFLGFGTQVLLYSNAMEQISPSVLEAGELDGTTPMVELFKIVVPSIMGTISTFMIATIAGAFMNQASLYNFYGENALPSTQTLGYYMFIRVQDGSQLGYGRIEYGYASALGLICTVIALPPTVLFRMFSKRFED